ncbi:MAG TPA: HAMP domain-containing sensor histidine kinase [Acidimicrobiales bacterium]|nr:HAMP domain-containing sensor histidine kinase [Acidimicrobiales bacterium]
MNGARRTRPSDEPAGSARRVRRHARDVAISATLIALVIYLASAMIADLAVLRHLQDGVDERLAARLDIAAHTISSHGPPLPTPSPATAITSAQRSGGDLDDAPIFLFLVPTHTRTATLLNGPGPSLPTADLDARGPEGTTIAGRRFTVAGTVTPRGRLVAATSVEQIVDVRTTLLVIEGALLPVMLLTFFLVANVIGRRAAAPIERARQQQLDFTADASHELRTPLSVIEAEVGLALSTDREAPAYRDALERIAQESGRLRGIVDDLIWLARLDAIPSPPRSTPVDLGPVVEQCASRFASIAAVRGVELAVEVDGSPAVVAAPAEWLDRLVSVLVDNACRYTSDAGRVSVAARVVDGRPTLTVSDTGPGIAREEHDEIFERFRRASTVPGGAGLGLAIADTIVRATSGRWHLGSPHGGGTAVQVSWPEAPA